MSSVISASRGPSCPPSKLGATMLACLDPGGQLGVEAYLGEVDGASLLSVAPSGAGFGWGVGPQGFGWPELSLSMLLSQSRQVG